MFYSSYVCHVVVVSDSVSEFLVLFLQYVIVNSIDHAKQQSIIRNVWECKHIGKLCVVSRITPETFCLEFFP